MVEIWGRETKRSTFTIDTGHLQQTDEGQEHVANLIEDIND